MSATDSQIGLAEAIAAGLPDVARNEWLVWVQFAEKHGLDRAITYAQRLANDVTVRRRIARSNRLIAEAMRKHVRALTTLEGADRAAVFAYVARLLAVKRESSSPRP